MFYKSSKTINRVYENFSRAFIIGFIAGGIFTWFEECINECLLLGNVMLDSFSEILQ